MTEQQQQLVRVLALGDLGLATNAPRVAEHLACTRKGAARSLESLARRGIVVKVARAWDEKYGSDYHVYLVRQREAMNLWRSTSIS